MKNWLLLCFLWFFSAVNAQDTLKMLFLGDIMVHGPQLEAARRGKVYDFEDAFVFVRKYFKRYDFVIGNLETTVGTWPYSGYPRFSAPPELLEALKKAGVDVLVTANNHAADKGRSGIEKTVRYLQKYDLKTTGTFVNAYDREQRNPLVLEKKGFRVALLNYTYGTNGLPVPQPASVNLIDRRRMAEDIRRTKALHPDGIIVFLHWGNQYQTQPSTGQKQLESYLQKQGIRWIIGSHPHVVQPVLWDKEAGNLTVFSLGNFVSNQRTFPRDGAFMIGVYAVKEQGRLKPVRVEYIPLWVYKYKWDGRLHFEVLPVEDFKTERAYFFRQADFDKMMRFHAFLSRFMKRHARDVRRVSPGQSGEKTILPLALEGNLLRMPGE